MISSSPWQVRQKCMGPNSCVPDESSSSSLPGWNAAVRAFLRSGDRRSHVRSGPAWVATQKHRPSFTRMRAVRPVSEGPQMPSRRVVKTNGVRGSNRYRHGTLGFGGFVMGIAGACKIVLGKLMGLLPETSKALRPDHRSEEIQLAWGSNPQCPPQSL